MNKKLLIFLSMICIFFYVDDVKAETDYYDDNGNLFRLVFDNTPLRNFVKNDFAIVYDDIVSSKTAAKFTKTNNGNELVSAYLAENELYITMYETTETYQQNNNIKYVVNIYPDFTGGTAEKGRYWYYKHVWLNTSKLFTYKGRSKYTTNTGLNQIDLVYGNGNKESSYNDKGWTQESYGGLLLAVDKEGNVERIINLTENYNSLMVEVRDNARKNIFYSSTNVYDTNEKILYNKEYFDTRIITSNYSLTCDDENPYIYDLHFDISDLKANDNVVISYNDDSILLNETLTEDKNSFLIENAKTGNYNVKVYDDSGELIHENSFYIKVDSDVQIDVSDEDININSDDDVSTILNKNNIFLNKALVIITPLIQIVVTFYNNLPTFLKLALISIFISLLIYLLVRRLT